MTLRERFDAVLGWCEENMPYAESELHYDNPFQLLVAVMLSAQCTDKRVNIVTPELFRAFPTPEAMASATKEEVLPYIRSISYPNSKALHLVQMAKALQERFASEVPANREELQTLAGVGRKTANVVCAVAYNQPTMAVDTHIFRVAERIGLTTHSKSPRQTEERLIKYIPSEQIPKAHHWLLLHGRYVCTARSPHCSECGLAPFCRYYAKGAISSGKGTEGIG